MTSNAEKVDPAQCKSFKISPSLQKHTRPENLRSTRAITELAEAVNSSLVSERYPSVPMPGSSIICNIHATYEYEWDD